MFRTYCRSNYNAHARSGAAAVAAVFGVLAMPHGAPVCDHCIASALLCLLAVAVYIVLGQRLSQR